MALSVDSKVKELQKNPAAADLLEKFSPGFKTNQTVRGQSPFQGLLQRLLSFFIRLLDFLIQFHGFEYDLEHQTFLPALKVGI